MAKSINNRYYLQLGWGNNPEYPTRAAAVAAAKKVAKETGKQQTIAVFGEIAPRRIVRAGKYVTSSGGKSSAWITVKPPKGSPGKRSNPGMERGLKAVAIRMVQARIDFEKNIRKLGGLTAAEAERAAHTLIKLKVAKLDAVNGEYRVTHGAYMDKDALRNAADYQHKGKRGNPTVTARNANFRSPMNAAIGGKILGFVTDGKGRTTHVKVLVPKGGAARSNPPKSLKALNDDATKTANEHNRAYALYRAGKMSDDAYFVIRGERDAAADRYAEAYKAKIGKTRRR